MGSVDLESGANHLSSLAHPGQTKVALRHEVGLLGVVSDTTTIVGYGQAQAVWILCQADGDLGCVCVLDGIVQRLLCDPKDRDCHLV
jgi:hypothetical protein